MRDKPGPSRLRAEACVLDRWMAMQQSFRGAARACIVKSAERQSLMHIAQQILLSSISCHGLSACFSARPLALNVSSARIKGISDLRELSRSSRPEPSRTSCTPSLMSQSKLSRIRSTPFCSSKRPMKASIGTLGSSGSPSSCNTQCCDDKEINLPLCQPEGRDSLLYASFSAISFMCYNIVRGLLWIS